MGRLIDGAVLRYFAAVGVDKAATLDRLREASDRRLADARAQREQAERDLLRAKGSWRSSTASTTRSRPSSSPA